MRYVVTIPQIVDSHQNLWSTQHRLLILTKLSEFVRVSLFYHDPLGLVQFLHRWQAAW